MIRFQESRKSKYYWVLSVLFLCALVCGCGDPEVIKQAKMAYRLGDLQTTITFYEMAVKDYPEDDEISQQLGLLYAEEGDGYLSQQLYGGAARSYRKALGTRVSKTDRVRVSRTLAQALKDLDVPTLELAVVQEAILEAESEDWPLRLELAQIYDDNGKHDEALHHYELIFQNDPNNLRVNLRRAAMLRNMEQSADAIAIYEGILTSNPELVEALSNLADLYEKERRLEDSEALLLKMIELSPERSGPYLLAARFYKRNGRPDDAQKMKEKARELKGKLRNSKQ